MSADRHQQEIIEQFTRQAVPFSEAQPVRDEAALRRIVEFVEVRPTDLVLDVACGPGIVAIAFARVARHVYGVDVTPAMIERASQLRAESGLTNVEFLVAEANLLPFSELTFDIVYSRFAMHHFTSPEKILAGKIAATKPGGRVTVIDAVASEDREKAAYLNRIESLRDSSHVRMMPLSEHEAMFSQAGLVNLRKEFYRFEVEMEAWLARSFPRDGEADRIRAMIEEAVDEDRAGTGVRRDKDGRLRFTYPVVILAGERPGPLSRADGTTGRERWESALQNRRE
jgi:ubiquinone/menaquinone biosynthesis C-methylase UbiE